MLLDPDDVTSLWNDPWSVSIYLPVLSLFVLVIFTHQLLSWLLPLLTTDTITAADINDIEPWHWTWCFTLSSTCNPHHNPFLIFVILISTLQRKQPKLRKFDWLEAPEPVTGSPLPIVCVFTIQLLIVSYSLNILIFILSSSRDNTLI